MERSDRAREGRRDARAHAKVRRARQQVLRPGRRPELGEIKPETGEQEDRQDARRGDQAGAGEKGEDGGEIGES